MKRFWKETRVVASGEEFSVVLDNRPLKLPSGQALAVPFRPLAEAIAAEWANTPETFTPDDLPLTRLASTAQDRVRTHRADIVAQLAAYGMNDLLCYRADMPLALAERERESWNLWLDWAEKNFGLRLLTTIGITPITQPPETGDALLNIVADYTEYGLAGLGVIVPALGSLILGLAVTQGALDAETACATALLDELWQEERWGQDDDAIARRQKIIDDLTVTAQFIRLCAP